MPETRGPDGAAIHYETWGSGHPLLLIAPGGVNSEIGFWERSAINPIAEFQSEFLVIGMDQRHAGASWNAPLGFSYDLTAGDQLAVLDAVGVERAHVWGGCIGVMYALRLASIAPERVSAIVGQDPVGLDETNSMDVFMRMFEPTIVLARTEGPGAVVASAVANPVFMANNAGGPYARRIAADGVFRDGIAAMTSDEYVATIERFAEAIWPNDPPLLTVTTDWLSSCETPLLILPGSDAFHPTGIAQMICRTAPHAHCLDVDCRSDAKKPATIDAIRAFLHEHVG
ncbi:MAG: alpha/beta hydrolase [Chloroflexi bacterium]|nr:alpha/beta hydrolase [Chloroflexota bacterium]MDA1001866.1 alpha/beta hydrolase [Chloroflexota bacterium]